MVTDYCRSPIKCHDFRSYWQLIRVRCDASLLNPRHDLCSTNASNAATEAIGRMNRSRSFGVLIALGFAVSFVMLIVVATVGYFSIGSIWNNSNKMVQTYDVIDQISELTSFLKDAETGQRGYLITGDDTYLEPYRLATA